MARPAASTASTIGPHAVSKPLPTRSSKVRSRPSAPGGQKTSLSTSSTSLLPSKASPAAARAEPKKSEAVSFLSKAIAADVHVALIEIARNFQKKLDIAAKKANRAAGVEKYTAAAVDAQLITLLESSKQVIRNITPLHPPPSTSSTARKRDRSKSGNGMRLPSVSLPVETKPVLSKSTSRSRGISNSSVGNDRDAGPVQPQPIKHKTAIHNQNDSTASKPSQALAGGQVAPVPANVSVSATVKSPITSSSDLYLSNNTAVKHMVGNTSVTKSTDQKQGIGEDSNAENNKVSIESNTAKSFPKPRPSHGTSPVSSSTLPQAASTVTKPGQGANPGLSPSPVARGLTWRRGDQHVGGVFFPIDNDEHLRVPTPELMNHSVFEALESPSKPSSCVSSRPTSRQGSLPTSRRSSPQPNSSTDASCAAVSAALAVAAATAMGVNETENDIVATNTSEAKDNSNMTEVKDDISSMTASAMTEDKSAAGKKIIESASEISGGIAIEETENKYNSTGGEGTPSEVTEDEITEATIKLESGVIKEDDEKSTTFIKTPEADSECAAMQSEFQITSVDNEI